jgi:hypothetical protein
VAPRSCSWTALTRPRWLSLITRRTLEAALDERADEGRPGAGLVVARAELEAQDPPFTRRRHPAGHERCHRDHSTAVADLHIGGIEPQVGIALSRERAVAECLDLDIEGSTDPAHLTLAQRGDPEGLDEVLDPAR